MLPVPVLSPRLRSALRLFGRATLVAAGYGLAVWLSFLISLPGIRVAPIRPPQGVMLAALLLTPVGEWWIYVLALLPMAIFGVRASWPVGLAYFAASALEAVTAAVLVRRFVPARLRLNGLRECLVFVGGALVAGPLLGAIIGAFAVIARTPSVPWLDAWRVWFFGDAVGNLIVVPALLAASGLWARRLDGLRPARVAEAAALCAAIVGVSLPTIGTAGPSNSLAITTLSMLFVPFPLLVWAGLRFGPVGAAGANLILTGLTIVSTMLGRGPFAHPDNPASVLILQQFLLVAGTTAMTLAGIADERRRTLTALQMSEAKFERAFRASPDAVSITSLASGRFMDVNDGFVELVGFSRAEVVGRTSQELEIWDLPEQRLSMVQAIRERRCRNIPSRLRTQTGDLRFVLVSAEGLDIGDEACVVTIMRDITERRQAEEALQDSENRYRSLFETATDVVMTTDLYGNLESANLAFETQTGWTRDDWFGKTLTAFLDPAEAPAVARRMEGILDGGASLSQEWRVKTHSGDWRVAEVTASAFRRSGQVAGLLIIARDITERQRAESERARLESEIAQSRKLEAVGQLAGGIAHDFNNLLQAILGFAEITYGQLPSGSVERGNLQKVIQAGERARSLTQQLLTFSRREVIHPTVLDLAATVREVGDILRRLLPADVRLQITSDLSAPAVLADRGHIDQVVMNLCVNARDAMPGGGTISVETGAWTLDAAFVASHPWAREGPFVTLKVGDTGGGIPPDVLPRVFEPFFTTKEVGQGTGLGLATVYAIVQRYDGLIDIDTAAGRGTTVTVYLPPDTGTAAIPVRVARADSAGGRGELILVAEDEVLVRELAVHQLERAGYRVLPAGDGAEALALFDAHAADLHLAFLDVMMPNGDGRSVSSAIGARRPDLPILFATGYGERDRVGRMQEPIVDALIEKPYSLAVLLATVQSMLGQPDTSTGAQGVGPGKTE